jgi:hypothetical protein
MLTRKGEAGVIDGLEVPPDIQKRLPDLVLLDINTYAKTLMDFQVCRQHSKSSCSLLVRFQPFLLAHEMKF